MLSPPDPQKPLSFSPEAACWLLSPEAEAVLRPLVGVEATVAALASLRRQLGGDSLAAERAAAVFELADLRRRAAAKFSRAARMFFTRKSLEQATDQWVARYKAQRFAGRSRVVDACAGAGGDLIALSHAADEAVGVDADPVLAAFAERNAAVAGAPCGVLCRSLDAQNFPDCDAWHADPDRRPAGHRTSQPDQHEPSLEILSAWRRQTPDAAVKLAPAARLPADWAEACELEWISRAGECRQLVAWAGASAIDPGRRRATRVFGGPNSPDAPPATFVGEAGVRAPMVDSIGPWLFDPDPAVLAADLGGALANHHGLAAAPGGTAYLTGDADPADPLLAAFEVVETLPLKPTALAKWLAARRVGRLEIKCRGVDFRPEALRKQLHPRGEESLTLVLFPDSAGRPQVVAAHRPRHN